MITGGAGFIGSHIVEEILKNCPECDISILDNLSSGNINNLKDLEKLSNNNSNKDNKDNKDNNDNNCNDKRNSKVNFIKNSILDENLDKIFSEKEYSTVFHTAAQISVSNSLKNPLNDANINIIGILNLLEAMRKNDVNKIVFSSSCAIYGNPQYLPIDENHPLKALSPYGLSKITGEEYIKLYSELYGIDYTILRYANVYGERQDPYGEAGVISIFIDNMLNNKISKIYGNGEQTRDFVNVKDVAKANLMAVNWKNQILNVGTGSKTTINELYAIISNILEYGDSPEYCSEREGDIIDSYVNIDKIKSLGWNPSITLKEGLKNTVESFKK
ncbi:NAD-dependent epimerase/dehydratase family protein [Methanococcus voltae]|uniref:NAD-dependent epimerase/dehydratase n=1 Tax=Methanococcus voltae (strain ATCC BAA-1334 / A3) TaxID=456320 RepID=D7DRZ2_METV3|nr:NAD-dependent epimerase/dehydratase family protein [Methanococcus voltae]